MAPQLVGRQQGFRMTALVVALALAIAVLVLAAQARSIWSTGTGSHGQPVPAQVDRHPVRSHGPGELNRSGVFDHRSYLQAIRARREP